MKILFLFALVALVSVISINDAFAIKTISDDSTGGDCSTMGTWNSATKTCTLSNNLTEGIVIGSNGITLDGNGKSITGTFTPLNPSGATFREGVLVDGKTGITIKNILINSVVSGIHLITSNGNTIQSNTLSGNGYGMELYDSNNNQINSNTITGSGVTYGIWLDRSNGNTVSNNIQSGASSGLLTTNSYSGTIDSNSFKNNQHGLYLNGVGGYKITNNALESNTENGIQIDGGGGHTIEGNKINLNTNEGIRLTGSTNTISKNTINSNSVGISVLSGTAITSSNNIIKNNDFSKNFKGISMNGKTNQVYNNNFLTNTLQATVTGSGNMFDQGSSIGGNYWNNFDEPAEGCNNTTPFDKYCDTPFVFSGGQDNYPWTLQNGETPLPPPVTTPPDGPFTLPCSMQEKGDGVSTSSCYGFYQNSIARAEVGINYHSGLFPITNYKAVGFFMDKNGNQGQNITVTLDKINPGESKTLVFTNPTTGFVSQFKMQMLGGILITSTDTDGDGISDSSDSCLTQAETVNGYQDTDGCPDTNPAPTDTDGDGISDSTDQCPTQKETVNGFQDIDGCPDSTQSIPLNLEFDKLNYQSTDIAKITITGNPSDKISLLIVDPSDKQKIFSDGSSVIFITLGQDGRKTYNLDLNGYTTGVYTAVVSKDAVKSSEVFTVGLQTSSGEIKISNTKSEYLPGESILVLGKASSNSLLTLTLIDPNGNVLKIKETFSDKNGSFSDDTFRIPADAKFGIWKIKAQSGSNSDITEFTVGSITNKFSVTVSQGTEIPGFGKSINIKVINAVQTVQIEIIAPNGEIIETLSFPASGNGEVKQPWFIPKNLAPGTYTVKVKDVQNIAKTTFEIGGTYISPTDTDKDGIPDSIDKCPTQKETVNGYQDTDGCPDVDAKKALDAKKVTDAKKAAEKKPAEKKLAEKKLADAKKALDAKKVTDAKKAAEKKLADAKKALDAKKVTDAKKTKK